MVKNVFTINIKDFALIAVEVEFVNIKLQNIIAPNAEKICFAFTRNTSDYVKFVVDQEYVHIIYKEIIVLPVEVHKYVPI